MIFDCETTGLPSQRSVPYMVQLAWGVYEANGTPIEEHSYIIKTDGFTIPKTSTNIHGISNEVAQAHGFPLREVLKNFLKSAERPHTRLVAHNIEFDIRVLKAELERANIRTRVLSKPKFCTMKATTNICKLPKRGANEYKWPSLQELYLYLFGRYYNGAHNALSDVRATADCFFELIRRKLIKFEH